jgi:hypothetical protein
MGSEARREGRRTSFTQEPGARNVCGSGVPRFPYPTSRGVERGEDRTPYLPLREEASRRSFSETLRVLGGRVLDLTDSFEAFQVLHEAFAVVAKASADETASHPASAGRVVVLPRVRAVGCLRSPRELHQARATTKEVTKCSCESPVSKVATRPRSTIASPGFAP